jgi:hypothetical protein
MHGELTPLNDKPVGREHGVEILRAILLFRRVRAWK